MKSRSTLVALALTVLLAVFLFILSCGTGPDNTNQNQNQNLTRVNANLAVIDSNDPCKQTTSAAKKEKLREKVIGKIDNDPILKKQYYGYGQYPPGHQNDPPRFSFEVTDGPYGSVEIHFKGDISGPGQLEALVDFLDDYQKKGCLERVTFTSMNSLSSSPPGDDFEWSYCEWPTVACPGGVCAEPPCAGSSNSNANSPPSGNSNTNSNSNLRRGNP